MIGQAHLNSGINGEHYQEEEGTWMQPVTTPVTEQASHAIKAESVEKCTLPSEKK